MANRLTQLFEDQDTESGLGRSLAIGLAVFISLFAFCIALVLQAPQSTFLHLWAKADAGEAPSLASARLYFDAGHGTLPIDAGLTLAPVLRALTDTPDSKVTISSAPVSSQLGRTEHAMAQQRAEAVREMLRAAGLTDERIELLKVQTGGDEPEQRSTRHVDVTVHL